MNEQAELLQVDAMIDAVVAGGTSKVLEQRAFGVARQPTFLVTTSDRRLVAELRSLTAVDWPSDEVADRIVPRVADGWCRGPQPWPVAGEGEGRSSSNRRSTKVSHLAGGRAFVVAACSVAAAALVVLALVASPRGPQPAKTGQHGTSVPVVSGPSLRMRLVDSASSPFQSVGGGPQTGNLDCVTATVCYADDGGASDSGVEVTTDGGTTWRQVSALPDGAALSWPLSCPAAGVCFGVASGASSSPLSLAVTFDQGADWALRPMPEPAGIAEATVDQLSCSSARDCVAHVVGQAVSAGGAAGTFLSTSDGGASWRAAVQVPPEASLPLDTLRCDSDGVCIGVGPLASAKHPGSGNLLTLSSTDGGQKWSATSSPVGVGAGVLLVSCGDTLHCMAVYPAEGSGALTIAGTSDGGVTWRLTVAPTTWPDVATSVSCPSGLDCYLAAADSTIGGYDAPVIEATHDDGGTWEALSLPSVDGSPLALVFPLSCPVPAGCMGVGATPTEFAPPPSRGSGTGGLAGLKCGTASAGRLSCSVRSGPLVCRAVIARHYACSLAGGGRLYVDVSRSGQPTDVWTSGAAPPSSASPKSARVIISNLSSDGG